MKQRIARVPTEFPDMETAVEEIQKDGDEIVSVTHDGAGSLFVLVAVRKTPRRAPGEKETRA